MQATPPSAVRLDRFCARLALFLTRAGLSCTAVWPTVDGRLQFELGGRIWTWSTRRAQPGQPALFERSIEAPEAASKVLVADTAARLARALTRLDRQALGLLDLRNREVREVRRSAEGLLRLIAHASAAWGSFTLESVRNEEAQGHDRFALGFSDGQARVVLAFLPDADDPAAQEAWLRTPLGALVTVQDERDVAAQTDPMQQPERLLAWLLSTGIHGQMHWHPLERSEATPPPRRAASLELARLPAETFERCTKAWTMAERLGSGKLLPCCQRFLRRETVAQCEQVAETSLLSAWNSAGMQQVRRAWAQGQPWLTCEKDCMRMHGALEEDRWIFEVPTTPAVRDNALLALREMAEGAEVLKSLPQRVMVTASDRCNIRCVMCSITSTPEAMRAPAGHAMSQAEVDEIVALFPVLRLLSIGGGEPLLEPLVCQLLRRFDATQYPDGHVHMVTNGLLLSDAVLDDLWVTRLGLTVSVNASNTETYTRITGLPGGFERLMANLRAFNEAAPDFVVAPRLVLSFVVMKDNYSELVDFMHLARDLGAGIRLLPVFGELGDQSVFTDEAMLRSVTAHLAQRVLPATQGLPEGYRHMVEHVWRMHDVRLRAGDFRPY